MANESNIDVNIRGNDGLTPQLSQLETKLIRFVGAVSSALTAIRVVSFPVTAVRQFEAEMANVQKTTNFTDTQIKTLSASLVEMSRRINISATDLAAIASAAGQQGLGREGVEGIRQFTESVSRMAAVLDITVEDAGANVGKIASIFKVSLRDIESVVSSFNQVSNNSTATGEQLLDVVRRIGDAAGSLKVDQAIAVAATGLDFGQSPEVVGTSFAKIFAEMFNKADQMGKLLKISTDDWLNTLQKDGIKALKMYLDGLRGLTSQQQQKWIKLLSGGGRIGTLLTKLVRDTDNAVLDRNLGNAKEGKESGTSAITEQLTVLKTLDAQIKMAYNSFEALGIKAGEVFGPRLTAYFAQLNKELANPAVISFAQAVGGAFLDMFNAIATGIKFLANLNVNWENFVQVAKVVVGLKLAQWVIGALTQMPLLGAALTKVGLDAVRSGNLQATAGAQTNTVLQNQVQRIKDLWATRTAYHSAVSTQQAAEIANSKALQAQYAAETKYMQVANKLKTVQGTVRNLDQGVTAARGGIAAAQTAANARVAAEQQLLQQRLQASALAHQAKITEIEKQGDAARRVLRAANDKKGVALANKAQATLIAQEKLSQERSLTQINAYYAKRILAAQQAGAAEVGAARLAFMQSISRFDGVASSKGFGVLTVQTRLAQQALTAADRAVVQTTASLTAATAATNAAAAGYSRVGVAVRLMGNAFGILIGLLGRIFFWFTIIYMALDAFGVLEKVGGWFQAVTDKMGLTSEARRRDAQEAKNQREEQDRLNQSLQEAVEVMDKYVDKQSGLLSSGFLETLNQGLKDDDPNTQKKAVNDLFSAVEGAQAQLKLNSKAGGALPGFAEETQKELDKTKAAMEKAQKELALIQKMETSNRLGLNMPGYRNDSRKKELQDIIATAQKDIPKLERDLTKVGDNVDKATKQSTENAMKNLDTLKDYASKIFTAQSAEGYLTYAPQYLDALQKQKEAEESVAQAQEEYAQKRGEAGDEQRQKMVQDNIALLTLANNTVAQIEKDLGDYIARVKAQGNLSDNVIGSLDRLPQFFNNSIPQMEAMLSIMQAIRGTAQGFAMFTGTLAPPPAKPATGEGSLSKGDGKGEARALSRARIQLARNTLEAEADLQRQSLDEQEATLEHSYEHSLTTIRDYYAKRLEIQRANKDVEIKLKQDEIAALNKELGEADVESARVRTQAMIVKAEGDIKLLQQQRKALTTTNSRELEDALRDFRDTVAAQRNTLVEYFGATTETESFQASLAAAEKGYRDFVQKLRTEAEGQPELLKMADAIEYQAKFQAIEAGLDRVSREASVTQGQFDLVESRINALRDNGLISADQQSGALADLRRRVIAVKQAELDRSRAQLEQLYDGTKSLEEQSLKYQELALNVAKSQVELDNLKIQANDTAKEINEGVKSALSTLFTDLASGAEDAVTTFLQNITNAVSQKAADGLADTIVSMMGGSGGGIGGFFAGLFGGDTKGTELNPMITKEWSGGEAIDALTGDSEGGLIETGLSSVKDGIGGLGDTLMGGLDSVTSGVGDFFSQGISMLMGFLGPLFTSLIAVVTGSGTASAASAGISAAGSAMMAHGGGIAGHLTMSRNASYVAPAFTYHTGGVVGLKADEVSAVLRKGEEVLTEEDPRHRNNGGGMDDKSQNGTPSVRVVPVLDPSTIHEAMASSQGEQVVVALIKRKASVIKQLLKG